MTTNDTVAVKEIKYGNLIFHYLEYKIMGKMMMILYHQQAIAVHWSPLPKHTAELCLLLFRASQL